MMAQVKNEDHNFIDAIARCVEYLDQNRDTIPAHWDNNSYQGRQRIYQYQSTVFLAVFGDPDPEFNAIRLDPEGPPAPAHHR